MRPIYEKLTDDISRLDVQRFGEEVSKQSEIIGIDVINTSSNFTIPNAPLTRFFAKITEIDRTKTPKHYSWTGVIFTSNGETIIGIDQLNGDSTYLPGIYLNESINNDELLIDQIVECILIPNLDFVILLNIIKSDTQSYTIDIVTNVCPTFETKTFKLEGSPP